jgi:L-asparaginase
MRSKQRADKHACGICESGLMKAFTVRVLGALLSLALWAGPLPAWGETHLPLVVVVSTGGTIAEKVDPKTGGLVPAVSGKELLAAVPGLGSLARLETFQFSNIDSSHMTPEIWSRLSRKVAALLARPEVSGVVITHGTDTMALGAFFLDVTLQTEKPVVMVGAMRGASQLSADGPANLRDAVLQAASPLARGGGVTVTMNQYAWPARCVRKTRTNTVQTFNCGWRGFQASIMGGKLELNRPRPVQPHLDLPPKLTKVTLLTTFAGDDGALVRAAVAQGAKGIVLEALGEGNVDPEVFSALKQAMASGVEVVITSRVPYEPVRGGYGDVGGGAELKKAGAILSRQLRGPKSRLLLMLALGNGLQGQRLRDLFQ